MKYEWKNKKVAVLGLGVEGFSSALYLAEKGATVTVLDQKKIEELDQDSVKKLKDKGITISGGEQYLDHLSDYDIIVRSPGIRLTLSQLKDAEKKGIITSQIKLFFDLCPSKIIGVTGTKGKGTTASLIYEMLKKQGFDAYLGGNIGKPPFEFLDSLSAQPASPKTASRGGSIVVLEISSFQLQDLHKSPHIAVVLMITSEHLNYHADINEYVNAKRNILLFQTASDAAIINRDYPASHESGIHTNGKVYQVSREREAADEGCFVRDGKIVLRISAEVVHKNFEAQSAQGPVVSFPPAFADATAGKPASLSAARPAELLRRGVGSPSTATTLRLIEKEIIDIKDILLPGRHNLENVCAAVMAAVILGVSKQNIASVLKSFKGLEHRLELVAEINGVRYYDDSFSTTPETAIAAIQAFKEPEILILGGSSKGSDFSELGRVICDTDNIKVIIGIGEEWSKIKLIIKNEKLKIIEGCKNMKEIAQATFDAAKPGDVVLLSPACASFDMFKNYKDRGEQFKKEVVLLQKQLSNAK